MKRIIYKLFFVIFILFGLYYYFQPDIFPIQKRVEKENRSYSDHLEIYFMDVGEADSTLIRYKDKNVLIDGGNTVDGKKLVSYFKSIGVSSFDYVIGTHSHEDHIGGFNFILRKFPVEHFYLPSTKSDWKCYQNVLDALDEKNILYETPSIHDVFYVDDLKFEVLWIGDDAIDLNQNSIVLKLTFGNTKYLFMADAPSDVEREIFESDLSSDVLRVGHHGSQYSSSAQFLSKVHPKYSIISVGKDNEYGFPKQVILDKLDYLGSTIYRTDIHHTIHLTSDGEEISFDFIKTDTNGGDLS